METNLSHLPDSANPWANQDKSLIGFKKALILGERTGHIANRTEYEDEKLTEDAQSQLPSFKLMQVLKKMSKAKANFSKGNLEIQCHMQDKETGDLTHIDVLEKRIAKIKSLNSHIESVIESKDQLIQRLQQPFQGDYLKLEAQYHRVACEVFPQITPLLSDLPTNLENIVWAKSLSLEDGRLDALISDSCSTFNAMQTSFQSYCQIRQSMERLNSVQTGMLHSTHIDSV